MRNLVTVAVMCIAPCSGAALADGAAGPGPHSASAGYLFVERSPSTTWQDRAAVLRQDRLNYLNGSLCVEHRDCSTALPEADTTASVVEERDYIDALSLGSYGPMDLKFTGDRVKLKVRF